MNQINLQYENIKKDGMNKSQTETGELKIEFFLFQKYEKK